LYLHDHLHELHAVQGGEQPSSIGSDIHHCLKDTNGLVQDGIRIGYVIRYRQYQIGEVGLNEN